MFVEASIREVPPPEVAEAARLAEELGFDGLGFSEVRQDPFQMAAVAATSTQRLQLATSVAIAFPRSPMVVAYATRNLQDLSGGRFTVGLGTQVRGHIQRRFSATWDSPGPRLREYVESLRAIWDCWQHGAPLDYRGRFYSFTLMTPEFHLGSSEHPTRVHLAAINPYNIATSATLCDGLRVHSFCTAEYLQDVIWPNVRRAAEQAGRPLDTFEMIGGSFLVSGPDEAAVRAGREWARMRAAFYGSTRAYGPVFEHHGWPHLGPALRELIAQGRWDDLAGVIDDEVLDRFCIAGTYDTFADRVRERLGGLTDRISLRMPQDPVGQGKELAGLVAALKAIPTARDQPHRPDPRAQGVRERGDDGTNQS
jgi:probable F420-dependent oxidoreductase